MICHQGSRKCRSEGVGSKKREAKMERVKGREGKKWSWRAEGSSLLQSFCYWLSGQVWMQHTGLHYWSVTTICATERRMGSVRVCEGAYMCAIYICSEMQDWICVPALGSMHIYVCVCGFLRSATWAHTLTVTYLLQRRGSNPRYRALHRIIAFFHPSASCRLFVPNCSHARSEIYLWVRTCQHADE